MSRLGWATALVGLTVSCGAPSSSDPSPDERVIDADSWIVFGRITDAIGTPLTGVIVTAHCGWGTLRPTGTATSDENGRYELQFFRGVRSSDPRSADFQVALIMPRLPGWFDAT